MFFKPKSKDLLIIEQLEQEIGKKLKKLEKVDWDSVGYVINAQNQIIELGLYNCEIEQIPECLCDLIYLQKLYLIGNKIAELPASFGQLQNLSRLWLNENQLQELPASFGQLKNLQKLYLFSNKISQLSKEILNLNLEIKWKFGLEKGIYVEDNPLISPPPEIIQQSQQAIHDYFESLEQGQNALNEIKILLVGDGGVGKTSLVKALLGLPFDPNEDQTHGININDYSIEATNYQGENVKVKAHLWDFGGQEVMHATHQFFLSKRSIYVLVLDGRKEEDPEYWLKHIESFGGNSPVLIILNKMDQNPSFEVNRKQLQEKYQGIHSFHRISCAPECTHTNGSIAQLKQSLTNALSQVAIYQTIWGTSWFNIKQELENLEKHYISQESYQQYCENHNIAESVQDVLVQYLHDLGVIIHFDNHDLLDTYVLEPKWVTEAVYKIINAPLFAETKGKLQLNDLKSVLKPKSDNHYQYPIDKHRYIIRLMEEFELCYEINHSSFLIPDLLDVNEPDFDFDYDNALKFKLEYDFLPRSIMPKFIVKRNAEILNQLQWREGVVLHDNNATAAIKADYNDKHIQIWVAGQQKRDYFATIRKTLHDIHKTFEKMDVTELVPLPDTDRNGEIVYVTYKELIGLYEMGQNQYISGILRTTYSVKHLLDGIESAQTTEKNAVTIQNYGTISSSNINTGDNSQQQNMSNPAQ